MGLIWIGCWGCCPVTNTVPLGQSCQGENHPASRRKHVCLYHLKAHLGGSCILSQRMRNDTIVYLSNRAVLSSIPKQRRSPKTFPMRIRGSGQTGPAGRRPTKQPTPTAKGRGTMNLGSQKSAKKSLLLLQLPDGEKEPSRCQKEIIRWQPVMLVKINKHQLFDPLQGRHGRRGVTSHPSALHKQQRNIWFWGIISCCMGGKKNGWGLGWAGKGVLALLHICTFFLEFLSKSVQEAFLLHEGRQFEVSHFIHQG